MPDPVLICNRRDLDKISFEQGLGILVIIFLLYITWNSGALSYEHYKFVLGQLFKR